MANPLDQKTFLNIIDHAPLVSIDLIVRNHEGKVLLGKRQNRPAQGYWFVPGGRVRKNETLADAFSRLTLCELGQKLAYHHARLIGAYDHLYSDNVANARRDEDGQLISTHYVALGHEVSLIQAVASLDDQHSEQAWWSVPELLASAEVHENTKAYFR